ncbi:MAG: cysteine desulfurase [Firmicutes bacterium]|nr:cysteine desulfurase [Bacillota bacterium]
MFVYFDNSATTKPSEEVITAMNDALGVCWGNPSSLYGKGLEAEKLLKASRASVAKSLGCQPQELYFTSCGTESDNWAIKGVWEARKKQGRRMISTEIEHPAVLRCLEHLKKDGAEIVLLKPSADGKISARQVAEALTPDTVLVSIMHVNNETGAVMPLKEIRQALNAAGSKAVFHTDAVQSYGKLNCGVRELGVDLMSISGHKVHASKGVGALYVKSGLHLPVFMDGGGQEGGQRSGTENIAGIAGLGAAAENILKSRTETLERMTAVRDQLKRRILAEIPDIKINSPEDACPSVLNVSFLGCRAEVLLHMLDTEGICVSTGSACSSHVKGSHVLSAMGLKANEIEGALRFSFSGYNTLEEADYAADKLAQLAAAHRKLMKYHKG